MTERTRTQLSRPARLALAFLAAGAAVGIAATLLILVRAEPTVHLRAAVVSVGLLAALATAGNLFVRFLRWQFLLRRLDLRLPTIPSLGAFAGSFAFLPVPLYLGQLVARARLLGQISESQRTLIILAFLWERALDVWALAVLSFFIIPWVAGFALIGGVVLGLVPAFRRRAMEQLLRLAESLSRILASGPEASEVQVSPRTQEASVWGGAALASLGAWALTVASAGMIAFVTGVGGGLLACASAAARAVLLGGLSMVPLGAGVSGLILFGNLDALGGDPGAAAQTVFVFRVVTVWLTVALGALAAVLALRRLRRPSAHDHFDQVSDCYDAWLPVHYRQHLVIKKTVPMLEQVAAFQPGARGLDLGCGRGWYIRELRQAGARLVGLDLSALQLVAAREYLGPEVPLMRGSVFEVPIRSETFDFAYIINALHHLPSPRHQELALQEIGRVVRPGGFVFVHEMNVRNLLFRFYLSYIFPILKGIEEGTEHYMNPRRLPLIPGLRLVTVHYFSFLPDFVSPSVLSALAPIEQRLERSFMGAYSAHFLAVFERTDADAGVTSAEQSAPAS